MHLATLLLILSSATGFNIPMRATVCLQVRARVLLRTPEEVPEEASLAGKAVWFGAELLGRISAAVRGPPEDGVTLESTAPSSLDESISRLALDYGGTPEDPRPYFLTGKMDVGLYAEDCEFADPFVSFKGRQRFVDNLSNLAGGFILDSSTRMLGDETDLGNAAKGVLPSYKTRLMVKLRLGLPWQPVLAWPWGVKHVFDPTTGLIIQHIESWEVSPAAGVRMLFTPGPPSGLQQGRPRADESSEY